MTAVVFADTAFYVAVGNASDTLHQAAEEFLVGYRGRTVTSEFVLLEVANFFTEVGQRQAYVDFGQRLAVIAQNSNRAIIA